MATAEILNAANGKSRLGCTVAAKFSRQFSDEVSWMKVDPQAAAAASGEVTKDGGEYRIFLDNRYLMPLELRAGSVAGLGIVVHNRDRGPDGNISYGALSNATLPGRHCANSPQLWPLMLLTDDSFDDNDKEK